MNGAHKLKKRMIFYSDEEETEYNSLKVQGKYSISEKKPEPAFNKKEEIDSFSVKDSHNLDYMRRKGSCGMFAMSDILHDDISSHYEEPLIEGYLELGELTMSRLCEVSFLLGLTSFGGPLAHQEDIKHKFVKENKLLTTKQFKHILNFCLVLPGYSSATLLAAIVAIKRKSLLGGLISLILFSLPSMIAVLFFSLIIKTLKNHIHSKVQDYQPDVAYFSSVNSPLFYSLIILCSGVSQASLSLMVNAAVSLTRKLSYSPFQFCLLLFAGICYYFIPNYSLMILIMIICGLLSSIKGDHDYLLDHLEIMVFHKQVSKIKLAGLPCLIIFFIVYASIYILNYLNVNSYISLFESFYRIGALSFGEGHVIVPMILTEFTHNNLIKEWEVLDGYALVTMLPGSMFNLAGYAGVIFLDIMGGILANIAIFLPGFLFVFAALPFMDKIKSSTFLQFFIRGVNSACIGFLFASAFFLWYDVCFMNPYTNPIVGTLNILMCSILTEAFKIHKPYIIIFGASFVFLLSYSKIFLTK